MATPKADKAIAAFSAKLTEAGAEILGATNPYEVLRFRTLFGVGVIYRNKKGAETWNIEAKMAKEHLGKGSLAPVTVRGRRTDSATVRRLMNRDGHDCFFCGLPLEADVTVEHLVAIAHGGPNHISNLFLAHADCNQRAGHLSAPEKIALAISRRASSTLAHNPTPASIEDDARVRHTAWGGV